MRDDSGSMLVALAFPLSSPTSVLHVEAMTLDYALEWSTMHWLFPHIVETDSLFLARLCVASQSIPWLLRPAITSIRLCLSGASIMHIFREANAVANGLA